MAVKEYIVTTLTLKNTSFNKGIKSSSVAVAGLSTALVGLAYKMSNLMQETAEYNDLMIKTARSVGTTAEQFSALNYAAKLSGLTTNDFAKSLTRMTTLTDATAKKLKQYGVNLSGLRNGTMTTTEALQHIAEQMSLLKTDTEKTRLATEIFGKLAGGKMVNLLANGADGIAQLTEEARRFGIVVSDEAGQSAELYNDNITRLDTAMQGLTKSLSDTAIMLDNNSGLTAGLADTIAGLTSWYNSLDNTTKRIIASIGTAVGVVGALGVGFVALTAVLPLVASGFATLGITLSSALMPITLIAGAIAGLTAGIVYLSTAEKKHKKTIDEETKAKIKSINADVKKTKQIKNLSNSYLELAKTQNKTVYQQATLDKKARELDRIMKQNGITNNFLTGTYKEQVKWIEELNKKKLEEINKKYLDLQTTIETEKQKAIIQENNIKQAEAELERKKQITGANILLAEMTLAAEKKKYEEITQAIKKAERELDNFLAKNNNLKIDNKTGKLEFKVATPKIPNFTAGAKAQIKELTDYMTSSYDKAYKQILDKQKKFLESLNAQRKYNKINAEELYTLTAQSYKKLDNEIKQYAREQHLKHLQYTGQLHAYRLAKIKDEYKAMQTATLNEYNVQINHLNKLKKIAEEVNVGKKLNIYLKEMPALMGKIEKAKQKLYEEYKKEYVIIDKTGKKQWTNAVKLNEYLTRRRQVINQLIENEIAIKKRSLQEQQKQNEIAKKQKDLQENIKNVIDKINNTTANINIAVNVASDWANIIVSQLDYAGKVAQRNFDVRMNKFEKAFSEKMKRISIIYASSLDDLTEEEKKLYENEIAQRDAYIEIYKQQIKEELDLELDKIMKSSDIQQGYWNDILLGQDKFWQERKAQLEEQFAVELEQLQADYEAKKELIDQQTIDKEERQLVDSAMEADYKATLEALQQEHDKRMREEQRKYQSEIRKGKKLADKLLYNDEKLKQLALERLQKEGQKKERLETAKHNKEKERLEKEHLKKQWQLQKAQYNATKNIKITEAIVAGISAASQAYSSLAILGPIGMGAGAALAAAIMAATYKKVALIREQKPIKPAALMRQGGVLSGPTHEQGGIPVIAEGGEAFIDKSRTEKLINNIDNNNNKIVNIYLEPNAIVLNTDIISDETIDIISQSIAGKIRGEL